MAFAIHFAGSDFTLDLEDVPPEHRDDLLDCGAGGQDALPAVTHALSQIAVTGDEADCRAYLHGYGAWEDDELADHATNLERLVWLTGCALREGESAYFSTYG